MNQKQKRAAERLFKALDACGAAGLTGGVYGEGSFYLWPANPPVDPRDAGPRFFLVVDEIGGCSYMPKMSIDGGSGA